MAVQRGSNAKWSGNYKFDNDSLLHLPQHAAFVAATIAAWAATEVHLGRVFGSLLGAQGRISMSIYSTIRSFEVQRDIIKTAAKELLPRKYAILTVACMSEIHKAATIRHHFGHWIWGHAIEADPKNDALLLVDPRIFWNLHTAQQNYWRPTRTNSKSIETRGALNYSAGAPQLKLEDIWVYRLPDLEDSYQKVVRAYLIAEVLRKLVVANALRRQELYKWLCNQSDIRTALIRTKKDWPRSPQARP